MANELHASYPGALTVYAIIRRVADGYAWDATAAAWEAWADGSIGDYDIPLTSLGGGLYGEDFPTGISAGTVVHVSYYEQQGASPATDDFVLHRQTATWTGELTESGAAGTGLVTLARALLDPALADLDEDLLNALILGATRFYQTVWHQDIIAATHTEAHDGDGQNILLVRQTPITSITTVTLTDDDGTETEIAGAQFRFNAKAGIVRFKPDTTADYSAFPAGFQNVEIVYIAGHATIPEDIQQATVELIRIAVENEPAIAQERMGDYTVAFRDAAAQLSPIAQAAIAHYRRILA